MDIRIAKNEGDSISASRIYAMGWKAGYRGMLSEGLLASIPLDRWVDAFNENYITKRFELAILSADGEDVGAGAYGRSRDYEEDGTGEITSIYFLEKAWGKGYSRELMDFIIRRLNEAGFHRIHVWVLKENLRARRFYEKCGFTPTGREKRSSCGPEEVTNIEYIIIK